MPKVFLLASKKGRREDMMLYAAVSRVRPR
jgi:hypothetical protein